MLFLINFILLYPTLKCGIVVDDDAMLDRMKKLKKLGFKNISLKVLINDATMGAGFFSNSRKDHLFAIIINGITTMLIYKLTGSLFASFLWLFNPINNQISIWLNGRRYSLAIMFVLIGLIWKPLFFPMYLIAVWLHVIVAPAIILILCTKYIFLLPALLYAIKLFIWKKHKERLLIRWKDFSKGNELQKITPKKSITYIKTIGYYLKHMIMPIPRMYHQHLLYFGRYKVAVESGYKILSKSFFFGLACTAFLIYEICQGNFWAFWVVLFISQWCGVFTVTMNAADRYCSLPAIGVMMILSKYIGLLSYEWQIVCYTAFVTIYIYKYKRLFKAYTNIQTYFDYHIEIQNNCVEARSLYATRIAQKEPEKAYTLIKDGLKYRPNDFKLLMSMSQMMFMMNRPHQALQVLDIAEQFVPDGEHEEAKKTFEEIRKGTLRPRTVGKINTPNRKTRRNIKKGKK